MGTSYGLPPLECWSGTRITRRSTSAHPNSDASPADTRIPVLARKRTKSRCHPVVMASAIFNTSGPDQNTGSPGSGLPGDLTPRHGFDGIKPSSAALVKGDAI